MSNLLRVIPTAFMVSVLAACGGGGGGGGSHTTTPAATTTAPVTATPPTVAPTAPVESVATQTNVNAIPVTVSTFGSGGVANVLYVTVNVCQPNNPSNCAQIPNVQVDTGSTGLRIAAAAFPASFDYQSLLPVAQVNGAPLGECAQFADGVSWGAVRSATVQLGALTATAANDIQIVGDTSIGDVPGACSSNNSPVVEDTVSALGANGIIGVGYFLQDCGPGCASSSSNGIYYACPTESSCASTALAVTAQVSNTVASMPANFNNGDVIDLPSVPINGASVANGYLVLGVGTQDNNHLPTSEPLGLNSVGNFTINYNGAALTSSFIDSGSSVLFFSNPAIATCSSKSVAPDYFCPTSEVTGSGTITGQGTYTFSANFSFLVDNAVTLFDTTPSAFAFDNLGAPNTSVDFASQPTFDAGLPFFFGHSIYTVFEQNTASGFTGPFAEVGPST